MVCVYHGVVSDTKKNKVRPLEGKMHRSGVHLVKKLRDNPCKFHIFSCGVVSEFFIYLSKY